MLKYEPKFVLRRKEIIPKKVGGRKAWKELKSKMRRARGKEVTKIYNTRKTDKVNPDNKHYLYFRFTKLENLRRTTLRSSFKNDLFRRET
jgi:hypothetical protein